MASSPGYPIQDLTKGSTATDAASNNQVQVPLQSIGRPIEKEPYYHGLLPREDVQAVLEKVGDFIVRSSEPKSGEPRTFVLSVMNSTNTDNNDLAFKHYLISCIGNKYMVDNASFDSIPSLIFHYVSTAQKIKGEIRLTRGIPRQYWELEHENVIIKKKLGEGAFGEVSLGELKMRKAVKQANNPLQVAIKQFKLEKMCKDQIKEFMMEARFMRTFNHLHVVRFYGVAVTQEPLYLVMELADGGALNSYLKKASNLSNRVKDEMVLQAAWGVEYLHSLPVIHRDLAARNCLYGDNRVKIADFGLTRFGTTYRMNPSKKAPVKWLALETLQTSIYNQATDVWSWGIMSWEIYHNGREPYTGVSLPEVMQSIGAGVKLQFEDTGSPAIQNMILEKCWDPNASNRFTMAEVAQFIQAATNIDRPDFKKVAEAQKAELANLNAFCAHTVRRKKKKQMSLKKRAK